MGPYRLGKPLAYPSHTHSKCHENLKKQKRETSHFQAINEEKSRNTVAFHLRQAVLRALAPQQGEGAAQRFGETKSSICSWAVPSSAHRELLHMGAFQ